MSGHAVVVLPCRRQRTSLCVASSRRRTLLHYHHHHHIHHHNQHQQHYYFVITYGKEVMFWPRFVCYFISHFIVSFIEQYNKVIPATTEVDLGLRSTTASYATIVRVRGDFIDVGVSKCVGLLYVYTPCTNTKETSGFCHLAFSQ